MFLRLRGSLKKSKHNWKVIQKVLARVEQELESDPYRSPRHWRLIATKMHESTQLRTILSAGTLPKKNWLPCVHGRHLPFADTSPKADKFQAVVQLLSQPSAECSQRRTPLSNRFSPFPSRLRYSNFVQKKEKKGKLFKPNKMFKIALNNQGVSF